MAPLWIARLLISERTAQKITNVHGIEPMEVLDAVVAVKGLRYVWDQDPERGDRAIVEVWIRKRRVLIVLYPATDDPIGDTWHLGSAYPV